MKCCLYSSSGLVVASATPVPDRETGESWGLFGVGACERPLRPHRDCAPRPALPTCLGRRVLRDVSLFLASALHLMRCRHPRSDFTSLDTLISGQPRAFVFAFPHSYTHLRPLRIFPQHLTTTRKDGRYVFPGFHVTVPSPVLMTLQPSTESANSAARSPATPPPVAAKRSSRNAPTMSSSPRPAAPP